MFPGLFKYSMFTLDSALLGILSLTIVLAANESLSRDVLVLEHLLENYDSRVGPFVYAGEPTVIKMGIYIIEMESFDDIAMEFTMVIYFRRTWTDPRLAFSHLTKDNSPIYVREFKDIWLPDIFFVNERDSKLHVTTLPNSSTKIHSNGTVFVSSKYSVTFACPMDMRKFPMDTQICKMEIESYSYPLSLVQFDWIQNAELELPKKLFLTQVTLAGRELEHCANVYSTGGFACLRILLKFSRKYTYHILNTYIPSGFIVVVSWISFWISAEAVPGRVTLGVTTVLTMTTQTFITGLSMPQVPYIKAIDVWLTVSMIFVFGALLEYAVVNEVQRRQKFAIYKKIKRHKEQLKKENNNKGDNQSTSTQSTSSSLPSLLEVPNLSRINSPSDIKLDTDSYNKIDKVSKYLFPVLYIFFATIYWVFYLNWTPDEQNVDVHI